MSAEDLTGEGFDEDGLWDDSEDEFTPEPNLTLSQLLLNDEERLARKEYQLAQSQCCVDEAWRMYKKVTNNNLAIEHSKLDTDESESEMITRMGVLYDPTAGLRMRFLKKKFAHLLDGFTALRQAAYKPYIRCQLPKRMNIPGQGNTMPKAVKAYLTEVYVNHTHPSTFSYKEKWHKTYNENFVISADKEQDFLDAQTQTSAYEFTAKKPGKMEDRGLDFQPNGEEGTLKCTCVITKYAPIHHDCFPEKRWESSDSIIISTRRTAATALEQGTRSASQPVSPSDELKHGIARNIIRQDRVVDFLIPQPRSHDFQNIQLIEEKKGEFLSSGPSTPLPKLNCKVCATLGASLERPALFKFPLKTKGAKQLNNENENLTCCGITWQNDDKTITDSEGISMELIAHTCQPISRHAQACIENIKEVILRDQLEKLKRDYEELKNIRNLIIRFKRMKQILKSFLSIS